MLQAVLVATKVVTMLGPTFVVQPLAQEKALDLREAAALAPAVVQAVRPMQSLALATVELARYGPSLHPQLTCQCCSNLNRRGQVSHNLL